MQAKSLKHQMKFIYSTEDSLLFTPPNPPEYNDVFVSPWHPAEGKHSQLFTNTHYSFFTVVNCAKIRYSHQCARAYIGK